MRGKENKGITLIALVITIIVLLILAAVVIVTLTGENGILTKTNQAKKETTDATAEEKVKIAVLGSYGKDGKINYEELQNNLNEVEGIDKQTIPSSITAESFPLTIRVDGIQVEITAEGEVSLAFNAEEWDKTATPEDCFYWGSDTKEQDGYDVIIGYTSKIENYTKLRYPSRCKKIEFRFSNNYGDGVSSATSRTFTNNIEKVEIPNTVVSIGSAAFGGVPSFQKLKEIIIPDSVTSIGNSAFGGCSNLSSITIPNSVTSIEGNAFSGTAWYNSQPDGLIYAGKVAYKYKGTMSENTSIEIKEGTKGIAGEAFAGCTGLNSITIPDSVTSIGRLAFENWTPNQTINIKGYPSAPAGWDSEWNLNCLATINWNQ